MSNLPLGMVTLLLLLYSFLNTCDALNAIENYCHNATYHEDKYVCDLFHNEMQTTSNTMSKNSLELKYSRYFLNQFNYQQPGEHQIVDIDTNSDFLSDLVNVLKLGHLIVLTPNFSRIKLQSLKTVMFKSDFRVTIRPTNTTLKEEILDESIGIFVFGETSWILQDLHQRHSQVTWILSNVFCMNKQSLKSEDSNIFQFQVTSHGGITLDEVYYKPSGEFVKKPWGLWTANNGFINVESDKMDRRRDLTGMMIKATTLQNPPYIWIDNKDQRVEISGFLADVWKIIKENLNLTDQIIESIDGRYGVLTENGSWNGMFGMLERNEVDIVIADSTLSENRALVATYTTPVQSNNVMIFIKTPRVDNNDWLLFVKLFRLELWLAVIGILLPLSFFYTFLVSRTDSLQGMVIFSGVVSGQGSYLESDAKVPRIILVTLLLSGLILTSSYSANLTSNLFIKTIKLPFHDLKSLYHQSDYKIGTLSGTLWYDLFSLAKEGSEEKLLFSKRFIGVESVQHAIDLMMSDNKFAFVWSEASVYRNIPNSCHFQSVLFRHEQISFFMRKEFPYKNIIDHQIRLLKESGQMNKLWNKWKPWKESNCYPIESEAVKFGKIIGPLCLFSISLVLSLTIHLIETMYHKTFKNLTYHVTSSK